MIVEHYLHFVKTQKKMFDCWYACIQMVRSAVAGAKTKPVGPTTQAHRSRWALGRKLNFSNHTGATIMTENHLSDVTPKINLQRIMSLATQLHERGPIIVGGEFGPLKAGHFIVISGCNTDTGAVSICDPGWGKGKDGKTWDYIVERVWKMTGNDDEAQACAFVADAGTNVITTRARTGGTAT